MDSETIIFLLRGGHLNMEERFKRKIWPHEPLLMKDLITEIVKTLKKEKFFPHPWVEKKDGEMIDDVDVIEMVSDRKYIYRARAASPYDLKLITGKIEKVFNSAERAAEFYLRNALRLPGDLDGWKVVRRVVSLRQKDFLKKIKAASGICLLIILSFVGVRFTIEGLYFLSLALTSSGGQGGYASLMVGLYMLVIGIIPLCCVKSLFLFVKRNLSIG